LASGRPSVSDGRCFPPSLRGGWLRKAPDIFAPDASKLGEDGAFVRLAAGLLGLDVGLLVDRQAKRITEAEAHKRAEVLAATRRDALLYAAEARRALDANAYDRALRLGLVGWLVTARVDAATDPEIEEVLGRAGRAFRPLARIPALYLEFSRDGTRAASVEKSFVKGASPVSDFQVSDTTTGQELSRFRVAESCDNLAFSPDGERIASDCGTSVNIWEAGTGHPPGVSLEHPKHLGGNGGAIAFSPTGNLLATCCNDNLLRLWDARSGNLIRQFATKDALRIAFAPDGAQIWASELKWISHSRVRCWTIDGNAGPVLDFPDDLSSFSLSGDGNFIVTETGYGVQLWDARSGRLLKRVLDNQPKTAFIHCVALSPDATRIATGSADNLVRLWSVETGAQIGEALPHDSPPQFVIFSSDGKKLGTPWGVWDVEPPLNLSGDAFIENLCVRKLKGRERFTDEERALFLEAPPDPTVECLAILRRRLRTP